MKTVKQFTDEHSIDAKWYAGQLLAARAELDAAHAKFNEIVAQTISGVEPQNIDEQDTVIAHFDRTFDDAALTFKSQAWGLSSYAFIKQ